MIKLFNFIKIKDIIIIKVLTNCLFSCALKEFKSYKEDILIHDKAISRD